MTLDTVEGHVGVLRLAGRAIGARVADLLPGGEHGANWRHRGFKA